MATVIDKEEAKESICTCYLIDPDEGKTAENMMCFTEGMLGTLSDSQDRRYCENRTVKNASPALRRNYRNFRLIGKIMHKCLAESKTEKGFLSCVEMKAKQLRG